MGWKVEDFASDKQGYIGVRTESGGKVCDIFPFAGIGGLGVAECRENARKIVNAEQLYDALKGLLDWVKEDCAEGGAYAMVEAEAALRNIKPVT